MATLSIATPAADSIGSSYTQNVGRAAHALLVALFNVNSRVEQPAKVRKGSADVSLMRLYRISGTDSMMPNLIQELDMIASRQA